MSSLFCPVASPPSELESDREEPEEPTQQEKQQSSKPATKKRKLPTLEQKIHALNWHARNGTKSQRATVKYFKSKGEFAITSSSFNRWCKEEKSLRAAYANLNQFDKGTFKFKVTYSIADYCLNKYFEQCLFDDIHIQQAEMISKWNEFNRMVNPDAVEEKKSNGWAHYVRQRNQPKKKLITEFNEFVHSQGLHLEMERLQDIIGLYRRSDVFQFDELTLTSRILPVEPISNRFIVGIGLNSDATEFLPLMVVSSNNKLKRKPDFYLSNSSLLTSEIFHEYLTKLDKTIHRETPNRRILLLLDRLHEHVVNTETLNHIEIFWFDNKFQTRNTHVDDRYIRSSYEIQPMSMGITKSFKLMFKNDLLKHYLVALNDGGYGQISGILMYELIQDTWNTFQKSKYHRYLLKCWEISDILPGVINRNRDHSLIKDNLEKDFWKLLALVDRNNGLPRPLETFNLTLNEILFPEDEIIMNRFMTDQDILRLVQLEQNPDMNPPPEDPQIRQMSIAELNGALMHINPLICNQLNGFFKMNEHSLPESYTAFQRLLHCYIKESIDFQLDKNK